jgi:hypothetical protein
VALHSHCLSCGHVSFQSVSHGAPDRAARLNPIAQKHRLVQESLYRVQEPVPVRMYPVCGCDGVTYSNECYAAAARTGVSHLGECVVENDCPANGSGNLCGDLFYCASSPGQCDGTVLGTCQPMPQTCPYNWDPVCGCDGVTYPNACSAHAAGFNVDHGGECPGPAQGVPFLSFPYAWLFLVFLISGAGLFWLKRSGGDAA